jgi:hypothetical protein
MTAKRPWAASAAALVCAATACWVSFGAVTFVRSGDALQRIGLLPSPAWLAVLVSVALLIAVLVRPSSRDVAPLWLSAVLIVPWLPGPLPMAAFLWTGHVVAWTWIAIGVTCGVTLARSRPSLFAAIGSLSPRRAALAAGLLALGVYAVAAWRTAPQHPSGDEPHYLVIAQSLLEDGDLQIENNHQQRDYAAYFSGDLPPDYVRRGQNGAIYSSHAPGLAAFVLPAFALAGYPGVVVLIVLIGALTAALVWTAAWSLTRSAPASWFAWAMMIAAPVLLLANAVFPDTVAPLPVTLGLLVLVEPRARAPRWLLVSGAAITLLPWLHTRLAILAALLGAAIALRLVREPDRARKLAAFAAVPVAGAAAWFAFFWIVYGTLDPTAPIGKHPLAPLLLQGLAGLLLDQKFGLFVAAPVALCGVAGLVTSLRSSSRRFAVESAAIVVPYVLMVAAWDMWWGGFSPPARFLTPIVPVLACAGAAFVARPHGRVVRVTAGALLALSLLIGLTMMWVQRGALIFSDRPDVSPLHAWLTPVVDLTSALPDAFLDTTPRLAVQAAIWLAVVGAALVGAYLFRRVPVAVSFGLGGQLALMAAVGAAWTLASAAPGRPFDGAAALVHAVSADVSQIGIVYDPIRRTPVPMLLSMAPLAAFDERSTGQQAALATPPLPAGIYSIAGTIAGDSAGATIALRTDRRSPPLAAWTVPSSAGTWSQRITIPVAVPGLRVDADEESGAHVPAMTLHFESALLKREQPFPSIEAGHGGRYGPLALYYMDGTAWLEAPGVWIGARSGATFALASDTPGPMSVLVRNGAVANHVRVMAGSWHAELDLNAGEERTVQIPPAPGLAATPVRIVPSAGFTPSEIDPSSRDDRLLGVWIQSVS